MSMDLQPIRNFTKSDLEGLLLDKTAEAKPLPFSLLAEITNDFSYKQEIGRGGFAVVYKGILDNGTVAVKRLYNCYMHEIQFIREVECLVKVKHTNIVRFLGYCSEAQGRAGTYKGKFTIADEQERLLCFEYLPEGSLDYHIEDPSGGLTWNSRYQILKGICKGLHYLHSINVLHLDLKPQNILMGDNMIPKITDFGLSRVLHEKQTRITATTMFGTEGYLAPESTSYEITPKFDLYSLGVLIMEIMTGKKERQVVEQVLESWGNRLDLSEGNPDRDQIRVCAEIGFECTDLDPTKRPVSMTHIMDRLAKTEKEGQPKKNGPWGGTTSDKLHDFSSNLPVRLQSVTVIYFFAVNGLRFNYIGQDGYEHASEIFGNSSFSASTKTEIIELGPTEFVTELSGTYDFSARSKNIAIYSLKLVTNLGNTHGPFGAGKGTRFSFSVPPDNRIVGFFGGSTSYAVNSIGAYTLENSV